MLNNIQWYRRLVGGRWATVTGMVWGRRWITLPATSLDAAEEDWSQGDVSRQRATEEKACRQKYQDIVYDACRAVESFRPELRPVTIEKLPNRIRESLRAFRNEIVDEERLRLKAVSDRDDALAQLSLASSGGLGMSDEAIGRRIIDTIVSGGLIHSECPDAPECGVVSVWAQNAAEQIGRLAIELVKGQELPDPASDGKGGE